ncbi:MAG: lysylphosphatidylglycerol synthase transmembrane domain-containing protein [Candidatus Zixiibacteriota bacterium]
MIWKKKQFWGVVIAVALLVFCLKDVRPGEIKELFGRISYTFFVLSLISTVLFIVLRGLRWRLMVSQQKQIGFMRSITLYSAGQILNVVMPALTGQIGRMFLFAKRERMKKTFVFSTMLLEVLFDAISLVVFLMLTSLAFVFPQRYRFLSLVLAGLTLGALILLYLILHYQSQLERIGQKWFRERRPGLYIGMRKFIRSFTKGIELLRSSQHLLGSVALSLTSWLLHMFVIYFLFRSFGFELPLASAAAVMIINTLAIMIPITPGNAGTFEVAVSTSLLAFSIRRSDAVLFALALHILDLLPVYVLGSIFLHFEKVSIKDIKARHEDQRLLDQISENGVLVEKEESV